VGKTLVGRDGGVFGDTVLLMYGRIVGQGERRGEDWNKNGR
jgi:hypothetical protein